MYALKLLGGARLEGPDGPIEGAAGRRQRLSLLAYLAMVGRDGVSRDRVVGLFWPDSPDARARHALSNDLYAIRSGLGDSTVLSYGDDLRIDPEHLEVDARAFEDAVNDGALEKAAQLYAGHFMEGVRLKSGELERWVDDQRRRLSTAYSAALEELATNEAERGDWATAAEWWRRAVVNQPLNSRATMGLMRALASRGDLAGALRHARVHAQLLHAELGVAADQAVEALANDLRTGKQVAVAPTVVRETALAPTVDPAPDDVAPPELVEDHSIAVLPFANLSADSDHDYLAEGLAEEVIHYLTRIDGLRVAARTSTFAYRDVAIDIREIGSALGVAHVLEGSIRVVGDRVRATAQLIDARSGFHTWSARFDSPLNDVLAIQDSVAAGIAERISDTKAVPTRAHVPRAEAHQALLKGRHALARTTDSQVANAIKHFKECVALDPDYAAGWAALAEAHILRTVGVGRPRKRTMERARDASARALELDPDSANANVAAGLAAMYYEWDHVRAERYLRRALELAPGLAGAHLWLGWFLAQIRPNEASAQEAVRALNTAVDLDPVSPLVLLTAGFGFWALHSFEASLAHFDRLVGVAPELDLAHLGVGDCLIELGRGDEAAPHLYKALEFLKDSPLVCALLAGAFGRVQITEPIPALLDKLATPAYSDSGLEHVGKALAFMGGGDAQRALNELEQAAANREHALLYLGTAKEFEPLVGEPRFEAVVRELGITLAYGEH